MPTPGSSTRGFAEGSNMSQCDDSFATGFSDNKAGNSGAATGITSSSIAVIATRRYLKAVHYGQNVVQRLLRLKQH